MEREKLDAILESHRKWLFGEEGGKRADLRNANLSEADLRYADLRRADMSGADLRYADLRGANLRGATLRGANMSGADLRYADLRDANLRGANLRGTNLRGTDLRYADFDCSCWPLWWGSVGGKVDIELVRQLLAYVYVCECEELEFQNIRDAIRPFAAKSHRAEQYGI